MENDQLNIKKIKIIKVDKNNTYASFKSQPRYR